MSLAKSTILRGSYLNALLAYIVPVIGLIAFLVLWLLGYLPD
jgi:hypothetical protein